MNNKLPEEQVPSYISLHVGSRGRYYWDIKINLLPVEKPFDSVEMTIHLIKEADRKLREAFPYNAAEIKNTSRFGKFQDGDE